MADYLTFQAFNQYPDLYRCKSHPTIGQATNKNK